MLVFIPRDLACPTDAKKPLHLVGRRFPGPRPAIVVIGGLDPDFLARLQSDSPHAQNPPLSLSQQRCAQCDGVVPLGLAVSQDYDASTLPQNQGLILQIQPDMRTKAPRLHLLACTYTCPTLVLYDPPDPDYHRYLTRAPNCRGPSSTEADEGHTFIQTINEINQAVSTRRKLSGLQPPPSCRKSDLRLLEPLRWARRVAACPALLSRSRAASQIVLRLTQATDAPLLASDLRRRRHAGEPASRLSRPYMAVWGSLWLISYDILLGQLAAAALTSFLDAGREVQVSRAVYDSLVQRPLELLTWLEQWPVGLKLNTPLATFLGDMARAVLLVFDELLLTPLLQGDTPRIIVRGMILAAKYGGLSMLLALFSDSLAVLTLHLRLLHAGLARATRALAQSLVALFLLFQARRRNPLRGGRIDRTGQYELDHTLLGTLLFTLLLFLAPTVGIYYFSAAIPLGGVVLLNGLLDTGRATVNFFPLLGLLLRAKDPARVPGAVSLLPLGAADGWAMRYELASCPASISQLFEGYTEQLAPLRSVPKVWRDLGCARTIPLEAPPMSIPFLTDLDDTHL